MPRSDYLWPDYSHRIFSQHIFERTRPDNMTTQKLRPGGSPERRGSDIQIASDKLTPRLSTDNMNAQLNAVEASVREKDKKYVLHSIISFIPARIGPDLTIPGSIPAMRVVTRR